MFKTILRSLFGPPREPFHDPVLGELKPASVGWSVRVTRGRDSFEFTIGGAKQPAAALLAHAREILSNFESFQISVAKCVAAESRDYPDDVKAELAGLQIDNISLCWPDRPDDGMIFFRGRKDDVACWRCDYIGRKPQGLGCDT